MPALIQPGPFLCSAPLKKKHLWPFAVVFNGSLISVLVLRI